MSRRATWALMVLVLVTALAIGAEERSGPLTEDQRVRRITSVVRCPTCQGLSVAQSDAPAARAIDDEVRRRVQAGESDGEIKDYLVSRYGQDVILQPETEGVALLVWGLPVLAGVAAVAGLFLVLRGRRVRPGRKVSAADQALVREALRR